MSQPRTCPTCGALIPYGAPAGQCVQCLLAYAVEEVDGNQRRQAEEDSTVVASDGATGSQAKAAPSPQPRFGDFELLSRGGEGGMGVVYRARQVSLNRIVALKLIQAGSLATEKEVERFRAEAEAAASLDHPHIVPIYEVGEHQSQHYFAMKWVEGGSLADMMKRGECKREEPSSAAKLMAKVARAVHHAHQRGVLHRDLKPGNILIDREGEPLVTDFGLAKRLDSSLQLTESGAVMGTPGYMSPEQAAGNTRQTTIASDIFSLGAILYRLITGQLPFTGESPMEIILKVLEREPPMPRSVNPSLDTDLETICMRCLQKDPQRRYPSAGALADDLENWLAGKPIAARPVSDWERAWKWVRRHPSVSALSGAVLLSIVFGSVGVIWQWREAERERAVTAETNIRLELQRAEDFFAADKSHLAIATLARMVRENPKNRAATERLLSALSQRMYPIPAPTGSDAGTGLAGRELWKKDAPQSNHLTEQLLLSITNSHLGPIRHIALSPDGLRIISASSDTTAKIWDAQTGSLLRTLPHHAAVYWAEFSPDGSNVVTATAAPDCEARIWDAATGNPTEAEPMRHSARLNSARFSPSGDRIATASDDGTARLWDRFTGKALSEPIRVSQPVDDARFSANDRLITFSLQNHAVQTFRFTQRIPLYRADVSEIPTRKAIDSRTARLSSFSSRLPTKSSGEITCLDISSNLNLLASASTDKSARLWDARTLSAVGAPLIHDATVNCISFSPDGLRVATSTAEPTRVRVWDVQTSQPLSDWIVSEVPVACVAFSPDGRWVIANAGWKWPFYPAPDSAPAWLAELAEAIAGVRYSPSGVAEPVPAETFLKLEAALLHPAATDNLSGWVKALLATEGLDAK